MSGLNLDPRPPRHGPDPNMQPHVLVITGDTADERDFEIEHPDCPVVCHWHLKNMEFAGNSCPRAPETRRPRPPRPVS